MTKHRSESRAAFSIIELLVVMSIIAIVVAIAVPAARSISRNNDENQATNVVRSMITTARSIATSQHRMAGVVFFEETAAYSRPVNGNQTAMQIFVEDFDQRQYNAGGIVFVAYAAGRQYLPAGIKIATLSDTPVVFGQVLAINAVENTGGATRTRAILFDAEGRLATRAYLTSPDPDNVPVTVTAGQYPKAYGNWGFLRPDGKFPGGITPPSNLAPAASSPAFFLYSKTEMDAQTFSGANADRDRADWLKRRSSIVVVNSNTGTVIIDKGSGE